MHKVYAIRSSSNRTSEAMILEERLDKWYIGLPEHLQYNCPKSDRIPAPHIVTLHMDYWCTVLLLHRPLCVSPILIFDVGKIHALICFSIGTKGQRSRNVKTESEDGAPISPAAQYAQKSYHLCQKAANMLVLCGRYI